MIDPSCERQQEDPCAAEDDEGEDHHPYDIDMVFSSAPSNQESVRSLLRPGEDYNEDDLEFVSIEEGDECYEFSLLAEEAYFQQGSSSGTRKKNKNRHGGKSSKDKRRETRLEKKSVFRKKQANRLEEKNSQLEARKENIHKRVQHLLVERSYRPSSPCYDSYFEKPYYGGSDYDNILPANELGVDEGAMYERLLRIVEGDDIKPEDYDLLLLLDNNNTKATLKNEEIDKFPVLVIGDKTSEQDNRLSTDDTGSPLCEICHEAWEEGMEVRRLPCGHVFCKGCIDRWLKENSQKCPNLSCYWCKEGDDC